MRRMLNMKPVRLENFSYLACFANMMGRPQDCNSSEVEDLVNGFMKSEDMFDSFWMMRSEGETH